MVTTILQESSMPVNLLSFSQILIGKVGCCVRRTYKVVTTCGACMDTCTHCSTQVDKQRINQIDAQRDYNGWIKRNTKQPTSNLTNSIETSTPSIPKVTHIHP